MRNLAMVGDVMRRRAAGCMAGIYLLFVILASLFPAAFTHHDPTATSPSEKLLAPSALHWFGTDQLGRDVYTRVLYGGRETIVASLLALVIAVVGGIDHRGYRRICRRMGGCHSDEDGGCAPIHPLLVAGYHHYHRHRIRYDSSGVGHWRGIDSEFCAYNSVAGTESKGARLH